MQPLRLFPKYFQVCVYLPLSFVRIEHFLHNSIDLIEHKHSIISFFFLLSQLKDMAERLPPGVYDADSARAIHLPNGLEPNGIHHPDENGVHRSDSINGSQLPVSTGSDPTMINGMQSPGEMPRYKPGVEDINAYHQSQGILNTNGRDDHPDVRLSNGSVAVNLSEAPDCTESGPTQDGDSTRSRNSSLAGDPNQVEAEWIEQYEPGVYITLVALRDGTRDLKRVRFR